MSQMSFSDFEYAGKCKQTRREHFLTEMEQFVLRRRNVGCFGLGGTCSGLTWCPVSEISCSLLTVSWAPGQRCHSSP
ncbi:hypothetical protein DMX06_19285 [Pseudomonas mosselii]|nr:hypothetical protein DMX06_19285 [Pseudomonas mosselii]